MSSTASRYADYGSACPRCQQIINTIDITFQQGIFIYDLTFIQQELEAVLIGSLQRQNQLLQQDNDDDLQLPLSSMTRLANGKKPRDFKAERDRRRKALSGHVSRKRRMKKNSTRNFFKTVKRERNSNGFESLKKNSLSTKNHSESSRPIRSYRPINFTYPYYYETNNNLSSTNKFQINHISFPDQFWTKILTNQNEFLKTDIEKLINIDQSLLNNFDYEKEYNQHKEIINSNEYLFSKEKYSHPEFEYSIVLKHNLHLYNFVENISNNNQHKNGSTSNNHRLKRKYSNASNHQNSIQIDDNILEYFQRDNT